MIRTVVFDLDGTLLDTLGDLVASVNFALRQHQLPLRTVAEIRLFLGNGIRTLMRKSVGDALGEEEFEAVFQTFRTHYVAHCLDTTAPYPGILSLLDELQRRGIQMAIVSNKLHPAVHELNERFFSHYIHSAVGESATVRRKPNPDALAALKNWAVVLQKPFMSATPKSIGKRLSVPAYLVPWCSGDSAMKTICANCPAQRASFVNLPTCCLTFSRESCERGEG